MSRVLPLLVRRQPVAASSVERRGRRSCLGRFEQTRCMRLVEQRLDRGGGPLLAAAGWCEPEPGEFDADLGKCNTAAPGHKGGGDFRGARSFRPSVAWPPRGGAQ